MSRCTVVVTGAPLAARTLDLIIALQRAEYEVDLLATDSARQWVDIEALAANTNTTARSSAGILGGTRTPLPDAVVVCPTTFNTVNKVAVGIADTHAHGFLAECIAEGLPTVFVPMINSRLWNHPALAPHLKVLTDAGAVMLDIHTGARGASPVESGSGTRVVDAFQPQWVLDLFAPRS